MYVPETHFQMRQMSPFRLRESTCPESDGKKLELRFRHDATVSEMESAGAILLGTQKYVSLIEGFSLAGRL